MVKCCAPLCGNASYRKLPNITFHRFPKDVNLKNAWLAKIGRKNWQPKPSSVFCSHHFEAHLVDHSGFRSVLAPGAVPTIFDLSFQEELEEDLDKYEEWIVERNKRPILKLNTVLKNLLMEVVNKNEEIQLIMDIQKKTYNPWLQLIQNYRRVSKINVATHVYNSSMQQKCYGTA